MFADFISKEILSSQESVNRLANRDANIIKKFLTWVKTAIQNLGKSKADREAYAELRRMEKMLGKALDTARGGVTLTEIDKIVREKDVTKIKNITPDSRDAKLLTTSQSDVVEGKPSNTIITEKTDLSIENDKKVEKRLSLSSMALQWFPDKESPSVKDFESRSYKKSEAYKTYVEECLENMIDSGQVEKGKDSQARKQIEDSIDGIVDVAVAMKKAGYDILDYGENRKQRDSKKRLLFSSLEPNSDYFTSHDISTICDKRKNFAEIYDEIVAREEKMGIPQGKRFL
jgi:hypothetical protein